MERIRTDARELALLSLAAGFALLLNRWAQIGEGGSAHWTLDVAILTLAGGGALFGLALLAGHLAIGRFSLSASWAYGVAGAIAGIVAFFGAGGGLRSLDLASDQGLVTLALGLPPLVGATLGIIYYRMAGFVRGESDPAAIEAALARLSGGDEGAPAKDGMATAPAHPALLEAGGDRYFSGPLQVRTSKLLLLASGAAVGGIISICMLVVAMSASLAGSSRGTPFEVQEGLGLSALIVIGLCLGLFIPNYVAHRIAQKFRITAPGAYSMTAFASCIAIGLIVPPFLVAAVPTAFSMALYRRWAGLEPVPLPDHVVVADERALIPANHAARKYHKVVRA